MADGQDTVYLRQRLSRTALHALSGGHPGLLVTGVERHRDPVISQILSDLPGSGLMPVRFYAAGGTPAGLRAVVGQAHSARPDPRTGLLLVIDQAERLTDPLVEELVLAAEAAATWGGLKFLFAAHGRLPPSLAASNSNALADCLRTRLPSPHEPRGLSRPILPIATGGLLLVGLALLVGALIVRDQHAALPPGRAMAESQVEPMPPMPARQAARSASATTTDRPAPAPVPALPPPLQTASIPAIIPAPPAPSPRPAGSPGTAAPASATLAGPASSGPVTVGPALAAPASSRPIVTGPVPVAPEPAASQAASPAPAPAALAPSRPLAVPADPVQPVPDPAAVAAPSLLLLAGPDDTLEGLYRAVYRGAQAPPLEEVAALNPRVRSGVRLVFPAPRGGWPIPGPR